MKLFRVDMVVYATAYVKATNFGEAAKKVADLQDNVLDVQDAGGSEVAISGAVLADDTLPEVSLSPAMTIAHSYGDIEDITEQAQ